MNNLLPPAASVAVHYSLIRCPKCRTIFKATKALLSVAKDSLRCGRCQHVFPVMGADVYSDAHSKRSPNTDNSDANVNSNLLSSAVTENVSESEFNSNGSTSSSSLSISLTPTQTSMLLSSEGADQRSVVSKLRRMPKWMAYISSMLFLIVSILAFGMHLAYHHRAEIAVRYPMAQPWLKDLSALLGTQLTLPKQIKKISLEHSELLYDREQQQLSLNLLIKNEASFSQAYPHIQLTLWNARKEILMRRNLTPSEYLSILPNKDQGIPAQSEEAVELRFATGIQASDFELRLFYPD